MPKVRLHYPVLENTVDCGDSHQLDIQTWDEATGAVDGTVYHAYLTLEQAKSLARHIMEHLSSTDRR